VQRETPLDTSIRSFVSGGARGCAHEADDKKLMQEVKLNFLKGEMRDKVERPQPYGFTGYIRKAEYDDDGQIKTCAEHFTHFPTGNRAFPVCEMLDDRRYRLNNFKEGEVAVYDDQQQKVHLQRDRIYARSEYKIEMRVIKDQKYMDGHGKDPSASRDQQKDKSRRWSTLVMDKDTITIERTDIVNDDDKDDPKKHTQDDPEKHIVMLSRVYLDKDTIHVFTPTISVLWDEKNKKMVLNTGKTSITLDDPNKKIWLHTDNTDVVLNENIQKVQVGDKDAEIPAAMLGSVDSNGDVIVERVAKKVLVK